MGTRRAPSQWSDDLFTIRVRIYKTFRRPQEEGALKPTTAQLPRKLLQNHARQYRSLRSSESMLIDPGSAEAYVVIRTITDRVAALEMCISKWGDLATQ
ncbi:MAG: hypothetical protein ACR2G5_11520 [Pyrinomonadaceae bacterium]